MTVKRSLDPQFDLFVPFVADLPLRDQRETMERPFFSLAKRKRLQPIRYVSPNGGVYVDVFPNPDSGWRLSGTRISSFGPASTLNALKKGGKNDLPRTLNFQAYDVLKTIGRDTGGREYRLLRDGLGRLQSTTIKTNIRPQGRKKERQFSWIESWTDLVDEKTGQSQGMSLTVSEWFYEGILMDGGLLAIDPAYFTITGGRERWLYRVARKHAGGSGPEGFAISLPTLFEKSGAEGTYRRFKFEILSMVRSNELPGFDLMLEVGKSEPNVEHEAACGGGQGAQHATCKADGRAFGQRLAHFFIDPHRRHHCSRAPGLSRLGHLRATGRVDSWLSQAPNRAPPTIRRRSTVCAPTPGPQ